MSDPAYAFGQEVADGCVVKVVFPLAGNDYEYALECRCGTTFRRFEYTMQGVKGRGATLSCDACWYERRSVGQVMGRYSPALVR